MERLHIAPGDMLLDSGEEIDLMFFIIHGSVEVVQDDQITAILSM